MPTSLSSGLVLPATERDQHHRDLDLDAHTVGQTETDATVFATDPRLIDMRLDDLDREWDMERALEANAAAASLISLALGRLVSRRWYFLSTAVATLLLQHAVQGWCPPVGLLRRLGVRTQREIEAERYALKRMRGDFAAVAQPPEQPVHEVIQAIRH